MIEFILSYGIAAILGFLVGVTVQLGYLKAHGKRVILPFIDNSKRTVTLAAIGLALLSLFTIFQVERSDQEREQCQAQFQNALRYNTNLNIEENELRGRERSVQNDLNNADGDLIFEIAAMVGNGQRSTPEELQAPFLKYIERRNEAQAEFDDIEKERADNLAARKPYPEVNCGGIR